jgi:hypothetical protein
MKAQGGLKKVVFGREPTANDHKPLGEHWIGGGQQVVLLSGVAATGASPNQTSFPGIAKMHPVPEVYIFSDCRQPGKAMQAIHDGNGTGRGL